MNRFKLSPQRIPLIFFAVSVALIVGAADCSKKAPAGSNGTTGLSAEAAPGGDVKVKSPEGAELARFKFKGDEIKIEFGGRVLKGKVRGSGNRKYEDGAGARPFEIKDTDSSFKLKDASGRLLRKVKMDGEKIKIAANEEMTGACSLKTGGEHVTVKSGATELGKVKFYPEKQKVKDPGGKELFEIKTSRHTAAFGVLLCPGVSRDEAWVLAAEIMARGH